MPADNKPLYVKAWTIHDLWAKYEDITMHFNDLLIRLRTQALAGVAAVSTLVGIFTRTDKDGIHISWQIATDVFGLLFLFWIAIWAIDRLYYNRLLTGAVRALLAVEEESRKTNPSLAISLSTQIEKYVSHPSTNSHCGISQNWAFAFSTSSCSAHSLLAACIAIGTNEYDQ